MNILTIEMAILIGMLSFLLGAVFSVAILIKVHGLRILNTPLLEFSLAKHELSPRSRVLHDRMDPLNSVLSLGHIQVVVYQEVHKHD